MNKNENASALVSDVNRVLARLIAEEPPDGTALRIACFYPRDGARHRDVFFANLSHTIEKTMAARFLIEDALSEEVADAASFDPSAAAERAAGAGAEAVFFVGCGTPAVSALDGALCRHIAEDKVATRFYYVDLVVDLVQRKIAMKKGPVHEP